MRLKTALQSLRISSVLALGCCAVNLLAAPQRGGGTAPGIPQPSGAAFTITRLDPALDAIVSTSAKLELLGEHFGLTEGPVWVSEGASGYLLFSDLTANVIYKRTPAGQLSAFLENIVGPDIQNAGQQTRSGRMAVIIIGSNGLTLDPEWRLVICSPAARSVMRLEKDGTRTILADRYEGKQFNGPNDVVVKSNGSIYFTDGNSGMRGGATSPQRELALNGVYLIKNGQITMVGSNKDDPSAFPNGITLSPDEHYLYMTMGSKVMRYDVQADDTLTNGREFASFMGNDGMKTDQSGNLYSTSGAGPGEVRITSPDGKRLGVIQLPQPRGEPLKQVCATNVGFGDPDGRGLYITACNHLYRIRLNTRGVLPGPKQAAEKR